MDDLLGYRLLLGKYCIQVNPMGTDFWEYRILDDRHQYLKAGTSHSEEACRNSARHAAGQILPSELMSDAHWAPDQWHMAGETR